MRFGEAAWGATCGLLVVAAAALGGVWMRPPPPAPAMRMTAPPRALAPNPPGPAPVAGTAGPIRPTSRGVARVVAGGRPAPVLLAAAWPGPAAAFAVGDAGFGPQPAGACPEPIGVACPDNGFVLVSRDGGRSWQPGYRGSAPLLHVEAWPAGGAVAWGPTALVLTADGGRSWRRLAPPGPGVITAVSFASARDGWVTVQDGCAQPNFCRDGVYATTDGGRRWRQIARTAGSPVAGPGALVVHTFGVSGAYVGAGQGWLDAGGVLEATRNNGRTWAQIPGAGLPQVVAGRGRGFQTTYASGGADAVVTDVQATDDGGATWTTLARIGEAVAGLRRAADGSLWAVAVPTTEVNGRVGVPTWACAASVVSCGPAVWVGTHGGRHWEQRPTPGRNLSAVAPLDAQSALAVDIQPDGTYRLVRTTDGGTSWATVYVPEGPLPPGPTRVVGFWSPRGGWGIGLPGHPRAVLSTSDGGRTWHRTGALPATPYDAGFADARRGWATRDGQAWLETIDGGRTWQPPAHGPAGSLAGLTLSRFGSAGIGALVMGTGASLFAERSTNGGRTWLPMAVPANTEAVAFAGANTAWALQPRLAGAPRPPNAQHPQVPGHRLLATRNGGRSWSAVATLAPAAYAPLLATGARGSVWLVEDAATPRGAGAWTLLHTTDAGARWRAYTLPPPLADPLFGGDRLAAVGRDRAWLLTRSGLWGTVDGGGHWVRLAAP